MSPMTVLVRKMCKRLSQTYKPTEKPISAFESAVKSSQVFYFTVKFITVAYHFVNERIFRIHSVFEMFAAWVASLRLIYTPIKLTGKLHCSASFRGGRRRRRRM